MLKKWLGKRRPQARKQRLTLPDEIHTLMQWQEEGLPCVAMLNSALRDFEPRAAFGWHLYVGIACEELVDNGMPSEAEREVVDPFCERLDAALKTDGNALWLVRETWNGNRGLAWRVQDPEIAHRYLQSVLDDKQYPREFEYRMDPDPEWHKARWYFDQLKA